MAALSALPSPLDLARVETGTSVTLSKHNGVSGSVHAPWYVIQQSPPVTPLGASAKSVIVATPLRESTSFVPTSFARDLQASRCRARRLEWNRK